MTRILLVDDHNVVRHGIRRILQDSLRESDLIHEAATGQEAINMSLAVCYDLILLDISLPDRNGLDVLQQIRRHCPDTAVIILSMHTEKEFVVRAFRAGAKGYLTKVSASDELVQAVEAVLQGKQYITPVAADILLQEILEDEAGTRPHKFLSDRELQVACMIAKGRKPTEIADVLCISVKTVSTYRARILEKLRLKSNADIVNYCRDHHLSM